MTYIPLAFVALMSVCSESLSQHLSGRVEALMTTLTRYRRPYTLLEIGVDDCIYIPLLTYQTGMIGASLIVGNDKDRVLESVCSRYPSSVSVMMPSRLTIHMLETLGRCEHFDVVIVHDMTTVLEAPYRRMLSALTALGDHVFIVAESEHWQKLLKQSRLTRVAENLYASHRPKSGLDVARYTQLKSRASQPRYGVYSSYTEKLFYKKGLEYPLSWIHGINLVTFCMLHGVYPDDAQIRTELRRMRSCCDDHNDMVLGNFILQGTRLFKIDANDTRRRSDPYALLDCAVRSFRRGNTRLSNPQEWIDAYYKSIQS